MCHLQFTKLHNTLSALTEPHIFVNFFPDDDDDDDNHVVYNYEANYKNIIITYIVV